MTVFATLNAARVLDVPTGTPARPDSRSPCENSHLHALARNMVRIAGLRFAPPRSRLGARSDALVCVARTVRCHLGNIEHRNWQFRSTQNPANVRGRRVDTETATDRSRPDFAGGASLVMPSLVMDACRSMPADRRLRPERLPASGAGTAGTAPRVAGVPAARALHDEAAGRASRIPHSKPLSLETPVTRNPLSPRR